MAQEEERGRPPLLLFCFCQPPQATQAPRGRFRLFQSRGEVGEGHELGPQCKHTAFCRSVTSGGAAKKTMREALVLFWGAAGEKSREQSLSPLALFYSRTRASPPPRLSLSVASNSSMGSIRGRERCNWARKGQTKGEQQEESEERERQPPSSRLPPSFDRRAAAPAPA